MFAWVRKIRVPIPVPILRPWQFQKWSAADWRAGVALISGIVGGACLTSFAAWIVWIFAFAHWPEATAQQRIHWLGWGMLLLLAGIIAQLLSQGLAINKRIVKITREGIEISGGADAGQMASAATAAQAIPDHPPAAPAQPQEPDDAANRDQTPKP